MDRRILVKAGALALAALPTAALAQHEHMPGMTMPNPPPKADQTPRAAEPMPMDHSDIMVGDYRMPAAALGPYGMTRESSGTAWQPDASQHLGLMKMSGGWMLMGHGVVNAVYDHQSGPRGDDKAFVSGMLMGMASHKLGDGTVQFKAMVSPDPLM